VNQETDHGAGQAEALLSFILSPGSHHELRHDSGHGYTGHSYTIQATPLTRTSPFIEFLCYHGLMPINIYSIRAQLCIAFVSNVKQNNGVIGLRTCVIMSDSQSDARDGFKVFQDSVDLY
jgi:hypothetical protein